MIIVTHEISFARDVADTVMFMSDRGSRKWVRPRRLSKTEIRKDEDLPFEIQRND